MITPKVAKKYYGEHDLIVTNYKWFEHIITGQFVKSGKASRRMVETFARMESPVVVAIYRDINPFEASPKLEMAIDFASNWEDVDLENLLAHLFDDCPQKSLSLPVFYD